MPRTIERVWHRLRAAVPAAPRRHRARRPRSRCTSTRRRASTSPRGLSPADARLAARRDFGPVALVEDQCRDTRRVAIAQSLVQDLRYGLRALLAQPLVVLAATASIGAGAGATAFVVNLASELLFARPSARDVDSLVNIRLDGNSHVSYVDWRALDEAGVLDGLAGYHVEGSVNIRQGERTDAVVPMLVTANFFDVLGVPVALGRGFTAVEAAAERDPRLVVVSDGFWRARLGADRGAVGRALIVNGEPYTILGVLPQGLRAMTGFGLAPEVYLPLSRALAARPRPSARRGHAARRPPEARGRHRSDRRRARHHRAAAASRESRAATSRRPDVPGHQRHPGSRQRLGLLRRARRRRRSGARHRLRQRRRPAPGAQHRPSEGAGAAGGARRLASPGGAAALRRVDLAGRARHRRRRGLHGGRDRGARYRAAAPAAADGAGRRARLASVRPHPVDGRDRDPGERRAAGPERLARGAVASTQADRAHLRPPAVDAARPAGHRPGDAVGRPGGDGVAVRPQPVAGADVEPRLRHPADGRRAAWAGREPLHARDPRRPPAAGRRGPRGAARCRARRVRVRHAAQRQERPDVGGPPHDRRRAGHVGVPTHGGPRTTSARAISTRSASRASRAGTSRRPTPPGRRRWRSSTRRSCDAT